VREASDLKHTLPHALGGWKSKGALLGDEGLGDEPLLRFYLLKRLLGSRRAPRLGAPRQPVDDLRLQRQNFNASGRAGKAPLLCLRAH
jgi:hypothetical protein